MKCPTDETTLVTIVRSGIEIDHCLTCRGVWLDRGELEKLIAGEENNSQTNQTAPDHSQEFDAASSQEPEIESFLTHLFNF